ncbi:MAG TPA: adenylate/guanylate cyclase domain-containing protein [Hypericibacter adhaerens]|uniref:adenylate/guanylate cyclase domain-containing protein n=1 Tax=Hypericibacter adhaerens TaxID=2602016 RepID=UPI002C6F463E|nr:adenylate/guanylate cyclase domain-containing protein [Hypericibacter adhaerens]HWA41995.1 adenylate/guanylate cyclase domain-containing protein [Hypericibacter adhaerens]
MECPRCRTENPVGHRFCSACGQKLARPCTGCGFENAPDARFCGSCGRSLEPKDPAPSPETAAKPAPAPEGEKRPVCVLFADLVGFTELSARLDAEDLKALVESFYARADRAIADYGGTVDKHIGDAVMALFGAPVAHGDDDERAIRAALDIHAAMAAPDAAGRTLAVHIGIAAGEVVAGGFARGYTVLGESVNLASRLVGLAGAGETVISDALRQNLGSRVLAATLPPQPVKGIDGLVRAWRVSGLAPAARPSTPFVGRRHDRQLLAGMIAATKSGGRGRMAVLRGDAGIGKSRLAEEIAQEAAREGFAVHSAFVLDFGAGRGQDAVPALARSLLGLGPDSSEPARTAAVEQAVAERLIEPGEQAMLEDMLDLPSGGERWLIYAAMDNATRLARKQALLVTLARQAATRGPLLIVIEDLHWAEPSMLGFVAALAEATAHQPILLLVTTRPEGDPLDRAWRAQLSEAAISTLDLAPLRAADATALATAIIAPGDERIAACIARAQGNPLFLEQLLRHTASAAADSVPASVQSVVLGRLDRLPPDEKALLQAASVLGQRFHPEALAHLLDRHRVDVSSLIDAHLLKPDAAGLAFAHALIRDGVYGSLLKARRKALHRKAADWFRGRDRGLEAEHLDRAEDPGAAAAYLAAAQAAMAQFQLDRVNTLTARGLALATDDTLKGTLAVLLGETRQGLGDSRGALDAFQQAAASLPPGAERLQAELGLANTLSVLERLDEALALLAEAQADAERLKLPVLLARIHGLRGNILFPRGEVERCVAEHGRALALAVEAGAPEEEARAHGGLGDGYYVYGDFIRSMQHFERCVALAAAQGFRRIEVANRAMYSLSGMLDVDFPRALGEADAAVTLAKQVGHRRAEMIAEHMRFWNRFEMGDLAGAREAIVEALAISRQLSARRFEAEGLMFLGQVQHELGDPQSLSLLREGVAIARETPRYLLPTGLGLLAMLTSDRSERERALDEGEALLEAGSIWHNHLFFNRYGMEAALEAGDAQRVERYATAFEKVTTRPLPYVSFLVRRGRALAAGLRRQIDPVELGRLREEALAAKWQKVLPGIDAALAASR